MLLSARMEKTLTIWKKTTFFAFGTLLSRFSGLLRDVLTAALLGVGEKLALFFVAFRLANFFRRLFAESPLSGVLLPYLEGTNRGYLSVLVPILSLVALFVVGVEGVLYALIPFAQGEWTEVLLLLQRLMPSLIPLVGTGIASVFLQKKQKLFYMGVSSTLFNVGWVGALLLTYQSPHVDFHLCTGVFVGFLMQWFFVSYIVFQLYEYEYSQDTSFLSGLFWPFLLSLSGVAASQLNNALDPLFALIADQNAPAYLWYAIRMQQVPFSLLGIGFATAALPNLVAASKTERPRLVEDGLRTIAYVFVPLYFYIFVAGKESVMLLYFRGAFSALDVEKTLECLFPYMLGIFPMAATLYLTQALFAEKRYTIASYTTAFAVLANIVLNTMFVTKFDFGVSAVAYATAIASFLHFIVLSVIHRAKPSYLFRPLFASLGALLLSDRVPHVTGESQLENLLFIVASFSTFVLVYTVLLFGKNLSEIRNFRSRYE